MVWSHTNLQFTCKLKKIQIKRKLIKFNLNAALSHNKFDSSNRLIAVYILRESCNETCSDVILIATISKVCGKLKPK